MQAYGCASAVNGRITIVQESRFRLTADNGRSFLFTLARGANFVPDDLCQLLDSGVRVTIEYSGVPGLDSCAARALHLS